MEEAQKKKKHLMGSSTSRKKTVCRIGHQSDLTPITEPGEGTKVIKQQERIRPRSEDDGIESGTEERKRENV